jgi:hypothetical protein
MSNKKQGVERMNQLNQRKKEAAVDKPADLPKDIAEQSIVHILSPSGPSDCWTMTVATTVPPDEQ